jgi:hypothetical protein
VCCLREWVPEGDNQTAFLRQALPSEVQPDAQGGSMKEQLVHFSDDGSSFHFTIDATGLDLNEPVTFEFSVDLAKMTSKERKQALIEAFREQLDKAMLDIRIKAANLPAHVARAGAGYNGIEGICGNLAFILRVFLNSNPICDLSRRGLQSVQFELPFKDLTMVRAEAFTYKQGVKAALTGLEENVFFSLFNDRFLGISPNKGCSVIEGDTRALAEIIGDNAPRLSVLNDIIRNLSRMEFSVPGVGHELHGRLFPVALCPDEGATQSENSYLFKFEVSDWIPAALLKSQFERIDLRIFWNIKTPAARRLYAVMKSITSGYAPRIGTLCERIGLPYPAEKGKACIERRAKSKAILKKYLQEIEGDTNGLVVPVDRNWFKGEKVHWKLGAKQIQNRVTERDEDAEYGRLYNTMPQKAKALYQTMKSGGSPKSALQGVIKRYCREGGHLQIAMSQKAGKRG